MSPSASFSLQCTWHTTTITCMLLLVLFLHSLPFHTSFRYEASRAHSTYNKLISAVRGKFDHFRPSIEILSEVGHGPGSPSVEEYGNASLYVLCFPYLSLVSGRMELAALGVRYESYYSSHAQDLGCLLALLDAEEKARLLGSSSSSSSRSRSRNSTSAIGTDTADTSVHDKNIQCNLVLPLGNMRKVDTSFLVGISYMHHHATLVMHDTDTDMWQTALQDTKEALTAMEKDYIIAHHVARQLNLQHNYTKVESSSIDVDTAAPLQISIGMNMAWAASLMERKVKQDHHNNTITVLQEKYLGRWLSYDYLRLDSHVTKFLDFEETKHPHVHRINDNSNNKGSRKLINSFVYLTSRYSHVNNVHNENNYHDDDNDDHDHHHHHHYQKRDQNQTRLFRDGSDVGIDCDCYYAKFKFAYHNSRIDIKLSLEDIKGQNNAICLLHLVRAITADPVVSSVSLSPDVRLLNYHARCIVQSGNYESEPWYGYILAF